MKNKAIIILTACLLIMTLIPYGRIEASENDSISGLDLSINIDIGMNDDIKEIESVPESDPYDYNPEWTITLNNSRIILHISEEDYSILGDGGTENYVRSLDRLGFTAESAREILLSSGAMIEIFPTTAGEYTDYILFFRDKGMYEGAEDKSLAKLIEEESPIVERFREDCRAWIIPENTEEDIICEENIKIGPLSWDIYTIPYDNCTSIHYLTIQNGSWLAIEGLYWENQYEETVKTAVENILQSAEILQDEEVPVESKIDENELLRQLFGNNALQLSDQLGITSFDIVDYFPFGTQKDTIRTALEKNHTIYESEGSDSNEFYVFYQMGLNEDWQCFYEFDENDNLISVTLAYIGEATSSELSQAFQRALDHMTEKCGTYETDDQTAIDLLKEDKNTFIQKLNNGEVDIMVKWQDAFGHEGEELYLTFTQVQGKISLFMTYFSKGYQH